MKEFGILHGFSQKTNIDTDAEERTSEQTVKKSKILIGGDDLAHAHPEEVPETEDEVAEIMPAVKTGMGSGKEDGAAAQPSTEKAKDPKNQQ